MVECRKQKLTTHTHTHTHTVVTYTRRLWCHERISWSITSAQWRDHSCSTSPYEMRSITYCTDGKQKGEDARTQLKLHVHGCLLRREGQIIFTHYECQWANKRTMGNPLSGDTILCQADIKQQSSENASPWLMFTHQRQEVGGWEREIICCFTTHPWLCRLLLRFPYTPKVKDLTGLKMSLILLWTR